MHMSYMYIIYFSIIHVLMHALTIAIKYIIITGTHKTCLEKVFARNLFLRPGQNVRTFHNERTMYHIAITCL